MSVCWEQERFTFVELIGLTAMGPTAFYCWLVLFLFLGICVAVISITIDIANAIVGVVVVIGRRYLLESCL